jgi:DNA-binding NarL/FixJ family response regulator
MSTPVRISIVDDNHKTRRILSDIIGTVGSLRLVSDYGSAAPAIERLPREKPDVVLMDIHMPETNGVECVRQLKPKMAETQFMMLTVYDDTKTIFAALSAGATGYLLKSSSRDELVAGIQQIVGGGSPMSSSIARKVVQSFRRIKSEPDPSPMLSPREQAVLSLLTQGYLYKEIADSLGVSVSTVDTFIRRIYEKLQVHSRSEAVAKYLSH